MRLARPYIKTGTRRLRTRFLLFPMCTYISAPSQDREWRWLETASYVQEWDGYDYDWKTRYWSSGNVVMQEAQNNAG